MRTTAHYKPKRQLERIKCIHGHHWVCMEQLWHCLIVDVVIIVLQILGEDALVSEEKYHIPCIAGKPRPDR